MMPVADLKSEPTLLERRDPVPSHTLSQAEKLGSLIIVALLVIVTTLGVLVWNVKHEVHTLQRGVTSAKTATLTNREAGYKNRAITCAIYRNMVKNPTPLVVCNDPAIQKYQATVGNG